MNIDRYWLGLGPRRIPRWDYQVRLTFAPPARAMYLEKLLIPSTLETATILRFELNGQDLLASPAPAALFGSGMGAAMRFNVVISPHTRLTLVVIVPKPARPRNFRTQRDYNRGRHVPRLKWNAAAMGACA